MRRSSARILERAEKAEVQGDFDEAIKLYGTYLNFQPDDDKVFSKRTILVADQLNGKQVSQSRLRNAFSLLVEAVRRDPNNFELIRHFAEISARTNRHQTAATQYQKLAKQFPEEFDFLTKLGMSQAATEKHRDAIGTLNSAISHDKTNLKAYAELAKVLLKIDDKSQADAVIAQMVTDNPFNPMAYVERSKYLQSSKLESDQQAAQNDIEEALKIAPNSLEVIVAAAESAMFFKDLDKLHQVLSHGEKLYADSNRLARLRGKYLELMDKPEEAIRIIAGISETLQDKIDFIEILIKAKKFNQAKIKIRELRTSNATQICEYYQARVLVAQEQWTEARQKLQRLRPAVARRADLRLAVNVLLGTCYQQLNQTDQQIAIFREVLKLDPTQPIAQSGLAAGLAYLGKYDEALKMYRDLIDLEGSKKFLQNDTWVNNYFWLLNLLDKFTPADDEMLGNVGNTSVSCIVLRADRLLKKGEIQAAERMVADLLADHPDEIMAWTAMANLKVIQRQPEKGIAVLDKAILRLGNRLPFRLAKVEIATFMSPDTRFKMLAKLQENITGFSEMEQVSLWQRLGLAYYRLGDKPSTRELWERIATLTPDDLKVRMMLVELALDMNDELALNDAVAAVKNIAGDQQAESHYCEATKLFWAIKHDQLEIEYLDKVKLLLDRATKQRSGWHCLPRLAAEVALFEARYDDAIADFQRAQELGPLTDVHLSQLARLLFIRQRFEEADAVMETLRTKDQRLHATIKQLLGQTKEALELGKKITATADRGVDFLWYGKLLVVANRDQEAEAAFRRAIELDSQSPQSRLMLVKLLKRNNRISDAEKELIQAGTQLPQDVSPPMLARGYQLIGDMVKAEGYYKETLDGHPNDVSVLRQVAKFYLDQKRYGDADWFLRQILHLAKSNPVQHTTEANWARRSLARVLADSLDWRKQEQALALLKESRNPTLEDRRLQARIFSQRPGLVNQNKAVTIYEKMLSEKKLLPEDRLVLSELYQRTHRWPYCRKQLAHLVQQHGEEPRYLVIYLRKLLKHPSPTPDPEIKTLLERLEQLQPNAPGTLEMRARLMVQMNQPGKAVQHMEKLLPRPLKDEDIHRLPQVARLFEELGQIEPARKLLSEYAQKSLKGRLELAEFLGRHGTLDEALDACDEALKKLQTRYVLPSALGILREQFSNATPEHFQRVEVWIQKAGDEQPGSKSTPIQLAALRELQGKFDEVIDIYREFLKRDDIEDVQKALIHNNLAYALAASDIAPKESLNSITKSINILGPTPSLLDTRGLAYLSMNNHEAALKDFQEAIKDRPTGVKYFHLAQAYLAMNNTRNAKLNMDNARKNYKLTVLKVPPFEQPKFLMLVKSLDDY